MEHIKIWCDASLQLETKKSGYAFIITWTGFELKCDGKFMKAKPIQPHEAEGMCIGNALSVLLKLPMLPKQFNVSLFTDCQNIIVHIQNGKSDLAKKIQKIIDKIGGEVQFVHIHGHAGIKQNEWCDRNAKKHIKK